MTSKSEKNRNFEVCAWCGEPLTSSVTMRIGDDSICPDCYWGYRRDKQRVKMLRKGVSHGCI